MHHWSFQRCIEGNGHDAILDPCSSVLLRWSTAPVEKLTHGWLKLKACRWSSWSSSCLACWNSCLSFCIRSWLLGGISLLQQSGTVSEPEADGKFLRNSFPRRSTAGASRCHGNIFTFQEFTRPFSALT